MKKIIILLILNFTIVSYANQRYENFANVILSFNKDKFIVVLEGAVPSFKERIRYSKEMSVNTKSKIKYCKLMNSYCNLIKSNVFVPISYSLTTSYYQQSIPITNNTQWLVILELSYENGIKDKYNFFDDKEIEELNKSTGINKDRFFSIPKPQLDNCFYLKKDKDPLLGAKSVSSLSILEDVQVLSKLFCDRKDKPFKALGVEELKLVTKVMSELKSEEGKKIAEAMVSIIEDEITKDAL